MHSKRIWIAVALAVGLIAAIGLVACGGDDNGDTTTAAGTTTDQAAASGGGAGKAVQVDVDDNADLGQILVDGQGMTLYLFEKDTSPDASTCSGECAAAWPPVTTKGAPTAGSGADASKLTTFKRDDGSTQVSYGEWPLYYYAGDSAPGDTNGNDLDQFGAEWYAVTPAGKSTGGHGENESEKESGDDNGGGSGSESGDDSSSSGGGYGY